MQDSERLSGCEKLMNDFAMLGFEPPSLRWGEPLVWNEKITDGFQRVPHKAQFLFEAGTDRGDCGRGTMRRAHRVERRRQKRPAFILMLEGAIGADQGERLPAFQAVPCYRFAHRLLGRFVERTKRMRQCYAHFAYVDEADHCFAKPICHQQTGRHPRRLSPQNMGDAPGTEPLRVAQGLHHPRLVHRRERARRAIRFEQRDLLLQAGNRLQHHRHILKIRCPPFFETFESVDNLVISVRRFHDTQRQITKRYRPLGRRFFTGPKTLQAFAYLRNGDPYHLRRPLAELNLRLGIARMTRRRNNRHHSRLRYRPFSERKFEIVSSDDDGPKEGRDNTCRNPSESKRRNGA